MLSKQEILNGINDYLIKNEYFLGYVPEAEERNQYLYIQGLLDLYEKEKEKNKELEKKYTIHLTDKQYRDIIDLAQNEIKDKVIDLKQSVHKTLEANGITRASQLLIDNYFNSVLEE